VQGDSEREEVRRAFGALAAGGTVTMPLARTSWSELFGPCIDRYDIHWMIDTPHHRDRGGHRLNGISDHHVGLAGTSRPPRRRPPPFAETAGARGGVAHWRRSRSRRALLS
jgi:hypothetical protein